MLLAYIYYIVAPACLALQISLQLQPLAPVQQPPRVIPITLQPGQIYRHPSRLLYQSPKLAPQCQYQKGSLGQQKLADLPPGGQAEQYLYAGKYGALYGVDLTGLSLYGYREGNGKVEFVDRVEIGGGGCGARGARGAVSGDGEYLYLFGCARIVGIELKNSLTSLHVVQELGDSFQGFKVVAGDNFFIWASQSQGVRIYVVDQDNKLSLKQTLGNFTLNPGTYQKIVDIQYKDNKLYILGLQQHIFMFQRRGDGVFQQLTNISMSKICTSCKNRKILAHKSNLYIYSIQQGQQYVAELELSKKNEQVHLIRYFKGYSNLLHLTILHDKLLIAYSHVMNLYQINQDPRTIQTLINGVSNPHFQPISSLHRLGPNLFLKSPLESSPLSSPPSSPSLNRILLHLPTLLCSISAPSQPPLLQPVAQPCQTPPAESSRPCTTFDLLSLSPPPPASNHHILATLGAAAVCGLVVGVLVVWRRGKLRVIERIVDEINGRRRGARVEFQERAGDDGYGVEEDGEDGNEDGEQKSRTGGHNTSKHPRGHKYTNNGRVQQHQELHEEIELDQIQGTERNLALMAPK